LTGLLYEDPGICNSDKYPDTTSRLVHPLRTTAAGCQWLTPVILATQEAEIMRIMVQSQPRQIVHATLSPKTLHKNRAGGVALSSSPSTEKKKITALN
jgi:hypothetical protein